MEVVVKEKDVAGVPREVKRRLKCHGQERTAKKQQLIERVRGSLVINNKVDPSIDDGKWCRLKEQYLEKLAFSTSTGKQLPGLK